jgi:hypothetical protein
MRSEVSTVIVVRSLLAATVLALVAGLPVLMTERSTDRGVATVSAATASDSRHPEKEEKNRNDNWSENGNSNSNRNDNGNGVDDGDDERGNRSRNRRGGLLPYSPPTPPPSVAGRCYAVGQSGALSLSLDGGTVTLNVAASSLFPRDSRVTLAKVDPAGLPETPGPRLDEIVFDLRAQSGCAGDALGELPADANLGVSYRVTADKATLRVAILDGGRWVDVPTVPDPNASNPYVSATVRRTGVYVLYQAR